MPESPCLQISNLKKTTNKQKSPSVLNWLPFLRIFTYSFLQCPTKWLSVVLGRTVVKREPDINILPRAVALDDLNHVPDSWKMMLDLAYCRRVMPWRRIDPFFRSSSTSQLMSGVEKRNRAKIPSRLLSRSWATLKKGNTESLDPVCLILEWSWLLR